MKKRLALYAVIVFCVIFLASCSNENAGPIVLGPAGSYVGNLHTHTVASDGVNTYHEMVAEAERIGLDFLVITDHQTISTAARTYCPKERRLLCVLGEEIFTTDGHMIAIDISEVIPAGLSAQKTIDLIHEQGGLAIAAHINDQYGLGINQSTLKELVGLDAVEYTPVDKQDWYENIKFMPGYSNVFDSDAHSTEMLRNAANKCAMSELSIEGLKQAIKNGKCEVYFK
jgi:predicted metal-dependent phosphoesterase TrpH